MKSSKELFYEMRAQITKAGGLFYQYRPCRKNADIVYDIENIKHGVVYAQTPLNMNDPFDSLVGFSTKAFYEDCIDKLVSAFEADEFSKWFLKFLLLHKCIGQLATAIDYINQTKKFILTQRILLHKTNMPLDLFIKCNCVNLFNKYPRELKNIFNKKTFDFICIIVANMKDENIDEESLVKMLKMDELLQSFMEQINSIRDTKYEPALKEFVSKLTVTCFSNSGWDNPLMWAHYADSYSGICIEYDFNQINEFIGFIYPVEYSNKRPDILLQDIGIAGFDLKAKETNKKIIKCETDTERLFKMLLVKDSCWEYEKEWRIIDIGEANTSRLINLPHIKSITLGMNIDLICKQLIIDICKIKNIPCFEIKASKDDFKLTRTKIDFDSVEDDFDRTEYMTYLSNSAVSNFQKALEKSEQLQKNIKEKKINSQLLIALFSTELEALIDIYFMKCNFNNIYNKEFDKSKGTLIILSEILKSIKQIDESVEYIASSCDALNLDDLVLNGWINIFEKKKILGIISSLKGIIEKIKGIAWAQ